ncbi:MAG: peptidoglycan-binding protein [Cocleimonas sp.]|nr:peptidoglycan-binding protein [Cocleimonas sp.]
MKITNKLSIAALVLTGAFATGCSQQQVAGDSGASQSAGSQQVAGGSQASGGSQQSAGGSQVQNDGGSQQAGSQQQVETPTPVVVETPPPAAQPPVAPPPRVAPPKRYQNPWAHYHAEAPACAKTKRHSHKYKKTGAPHRHSYGCQPRRVMHKAQPPQVDVFALQRKLKAKGYYKGPIDGVVGAGTRSALKRFMQR